jgi:outer membrane protein OmpA-like peptidoglycan-associated protein
VRNFIFTALVLSHCFFSFTQKNDISICRGSVQIDAGTPYSLSFTGKKGIDKSNVYGYIKNMSVSKNAIWSKFEPGKRGKLQIKCKSQIDSFHIVVFKTNVGSSCIDLATKKAEPVFMKMKTSCLELENVSIDLVDGFEYVIVFITQEKSKTKVDFELKFTPTDEKGKEFVDTLTMNLVYNKAKPIYSIHVINEITKKPVTARISISSQSEIDGTYFASDLFLNLSKTLKNCTIKIDAEGYNSKDLLEYKIASASHTKDTIKLIPFKRGTTAKLDEIYFSPGLATILEDSYPRLERLRDFMVLNPQISIEIQGHVNEDKTFSGLFSVRLSKKRALRILDFLVESGIDPKRLTAVGFGNSKPVYPDPKDPLQKEANRRVEILIK